MEPAIYMEVGAIAFGIVIMLIGVIDYVRNKLRKYGENPPKLFRKEKL